MFSYDVTDSIMWKEVHTQPQMMTQTISQNQDIVCAIAKEVKERRITNVVLVGRGSSEHALIAGKYLFEIYTEMLASMSSPSVVTQYHGNVSLKNTLTIGISQCGEAQDVYEVLKKCQDEGGIAVSITNERDCLMRNIGNYYMNCECGKENSCTAAKSYMSQLLLVMMLAAEIAEDEQLLHAVTNAPDMIKATLQESVIQQIKEAVPLFRNTQEILILARGLSFAVAHETELKIIEASYTNARAYSACDYPHGPIANTNPFTPVIIFLTDEVTNQSTLQLIKKMKNDFHISTLVVTDKKEYMSAGDYAVLLPEGAQGISSMFSLTVFSQLFACLLSVSRGSNPDAPAGLSKTTITY